MVFTGSQVESARLSSQLVAQPVDFHLQFKGDCLIPPNLTELGIFEDIARNVDDSIPQGPDWHRSLLLQMSGKTHEVRPAVIGYKTRVCLDEYRGFRHIVRNVYTFNLRPSRLKELTQELRACYDDLYEDLALFVAFLNDLAHTDS